MITEALARSHFWHWGSRHHCYWHWISGMWPGHSNRDETDKSSHDTTALKRDLMRVAELNKG